MKKIMITILMSLMLVGLVAGFSHLIIQPSKTLDNNIIISKVDIQDINGRETIVVDLSGTSKSVYNILIDCGFPENKKFEIAYKGNEDIVSILESAFNQLNLSDPYLCNSKPIPPVESNVGKQYDFDDGSWKKIN